MKVKSVYSARWKWLFFLYAIIVSAGVLARTYNGSAESAPARGISGGFVDDSSVTVAPGAYTTFSTVSGGKRFYLGVDTTAAKTGSYHLAVYDKPCFATIWQVGALYSYTGDVLPDKNYQRAVKSIYLKDKHSQNAWLSIGANHGTYSDLVLVTDSTSELTLWFTQKDNTASDRYIQGFLYYSYEQANMEVYRYLTYDGLYGFDRAYSTRPALSQRVSLWGRTQGDHMACYFMPGEYEFDYSTDPAGEAKNFTFRMRLELGGDRFRSQYDGTEFYAVQPTIVDDQTTLQDSKGVTFNLGWSSTDNTAKSDTSVAHWPGGVDSSLVAFAAVFDATLNAKENRWERAIRSIGVSPKNIEGVSQDHEDYILVHMHYDGNTYTDSVRVTRRLYRDRPFTTLATTASPEDHTFPFFTSADDTKDNCTFTLNAGYFDGNEVLGMHGAVFDRTIGESATDLPIATMPCFRDTVWTPVLNAGGDTTGWEVAQVHLLDTLLVAAYLPDGVTSAIGDDDNQWIKSVQLTSRNQIQVTAEPYHEGTKEFRLAIIKYAYTYRHSSAKGDTVRATGTIWVTQEPQTLPEGGLLPFYHQPGKSGDALDAAHFGRQRTTENVYTTYAIPGQTLPLPIHRDYWGYYRWFVYKATPAEQRGKDISQKWNYVLTPKNASEGEFNPLNNVSSSYSHGRFDMRSHFTPGKATNAPAIAYKDGDDVLTKTDTLACDISIYTDTVAKGELESLSLTQLTEPTLSYRQLFDVRPAKEMADRMEECRKNAGSKYLQEEVVVAPRGRFFHLQAFSPYKLTSGQYEEGHLQYVYYYNPNVANNTDENMGSKSGWTEAQLRDGSNYHRIGLPARTTGGDPKYHARLMSAEEVMNLDPGTTKQVIMVNPRKGSGYVFGKAAGDEDVAKFTTDFSSVTDTAKLRSYIESRILNPNGTHTPQSNYVLTLEKTATNTITLTRENKTLYSYAYATGKLWDPVDYTVEWEAGRTGSDLWEVVDFSSCTDGQLISYANTALLKLHINYTHRFPVLDVFIGRNGNLTACDYQEAYTSWGRSYPESYTPAPHVVDKDGTEGSASNQGWLFYEIIPPTDLVYHEEHPKWYRKKVSGTWKGTQTDDPSSDWTTASPQADGSLRASYSSAEEYVEYKLESEHFNLAHIKLYLRDTLVQGPSTSAIITEDSIDAHYSVMASLGLEHIPAAGTEEMTTPYYHLQWNHTQFSYHFPVGNGTHQIPASQRVSGDDPLPAKGEYITTNKFEKAGHRTIEACAGAEHGYMFCYNRASKPLVFIDFTIDQPACTDQELTLVSNFANPSSDAPHVTAKMYGKLTKDGDWKLIYTYLTGQLAQSNNWYQVVLPLAKDTINKYVSFRCVGTVTGTNNNADAYFLFDRMRLLAKDRPLTTYQKRTTCTVNDSIFLISRIDYRSSELEPGSIICYQYQKWDNSANDGAGGFVPMETSTTDDGGTTYTRLPENETEVYPGYYKVGMTAEESVTNPAFKSSILCSDYGTIVVPEHAYNPSLSNTSEGQSAVRKAAIDRIAEILGDDRSSYYNETSRIKSYSEITTAETFDFGSYSSPQCKFYVNEGTETNPYWVMYLINRVKVDDSDNSTFRIAMNYVEKVDNRPNFSESACSSERIVEAKLPISANVDTKIIGSTWHNYTRSYLETSGGDEYIVANTLHTLDLNFNPPANAKEGTASRAECRFDLVRAFEFMRNYTSKTPEEQATADAEWQELYHCTVGEFQNAMSILRSENELNPNRKEYRWNNVTRESFHWAEAVGQAPSTIDSAYNLLNRLIVNDRLLEVGLSAREIYIGNKQDLYFYIRPITSSGTYIVSAHDGTDSVAEAAVCNAPIWLEMHSTEVPEELRLGYDKKFGDSYVVPVVRASAYDANHELAVRIAEITHDLGANTGITLGWDSTHVVETNDPAWTESSSFRYTQDKILQSDIYANYYKKGDVIRFRPVDAAHVADLQATDCDCYDYDPAGTIYDIENPRAHGASGTNALVQPATPLKGCNKWHKQAQTDGAIETRQPGYQKANNFELHAGYWYKFRTAFFTKPSTLLGYQSNASAGAPLGYAYFILAVAPDTAIWTPAHNDRTNYWNDDDNWTAIVNGEPFNEALARVPLEKTNVIISKPQIENHLPVVNNDSLGDVTKGDIDWGFKTATCNDILFRPLAQIYGQELLDYNRAFVDVRFQEGTWRTFSPALTGIYSGDMYVPEDSAADMASYFAPLTFNSTPISASHNRVWPYLFYQSFYNQTVKEVFNNTDLDGNPLTERSKSSAQWIQTNVLNQPLTPGEANAIIAWGPTNNTKDIIVRLPKQETSYHYIAPDGTEDPTEITLSRPAFNKLNHNLAFDKTALGGNSYKDYTLTNETAAKLFWFGNATMALIDVYQLCLDNADKLEGDGTSFVVYELTGESAYAVYVLTPNTVNAHNLYLAPMRAIGLMAKTPATSLTIRLNTSALLAMPGDRDPVQVLHPAPAKKARATAESYDATLYIAASANAGGDKYKAYVTLAENSNASDGFVGGEDAECIVSRNTDAFTFHTPLSMYTVCDNRTLMYDSRAIVERIPLGFAMQNEYHFGETITLSFATEGQWDRPLYLYDAFTNDSVMILNGLRVTVAAPQTDEIRYYINGANNSAASDEQQPATPTGIETVQENNPSQAANNPAHATKIYDLLGRHLITLNEHDLIYNVQLPTGVYIVQRGSKTERMVIK